MDLFGLKKKDEKIAKFGGELIAACRETPQQFVNILQKVEQYPKAADYKDIEGRSALHWACNQYAKLEIVQYLSNAAKISLDEPANNGMYPLHYALREKAPVDVIEFIIQSNPQVASKEADGGWYPLHFACAKIDSPKILISLLKACPIAMKKVTTEESRLPLHYASAFQTSVDVVASLVQSAPETIRQSDKHEWTPLHIAAAYSSSLQILQYLVQSHKPGIQRRARFGQMPIHVACIMNRPRKIIEFLIKQWPVGIKQLDENRRLPLHLAALAGASIDVIKYLIREWPQSAKQLGNDSFEITRFALQKLNPTRDEFEEFSKWVDKKLDNPQKPDGLHRNISAASTASKKEKGRSRGRRGSNEGRKDKGESSPRNRHRKSPTRHKSVDIDGDLPKTKRDKGRRDPRDNDRRRGRSDAELLDSSDHNSSRRSNRSGDTIESSELPQEVINMVGENLHQACEFPQSLEEIQGLLEGCPQAAKCPTHNGNLPLHTACMNKAKKDVLKYLIKFNRDALEVEDEGGNLPLHMACFSSSSKGSVQVLVEAYSDALLIENNDGATAITKARDPFYEAPNPEMIEWLGKATKKAEEKAMEEERKRVEEEERQQRAEEEERVRKEEEERRRKKEEERLKREKEERRQREKEERRRAEEAARKPAPSDSDADGKPRSSFYAAALARAASADESFSNLQGIAEDSTNAFGDDFYKDDVKDLARSSFVDGAAGMAVGDSYTAVKMAEDAEKGQGQASSFYQEALKAPRDSTADLEDLAKALEESAAAHEAAQQGTQPKPSKPAKPGIQFVDEPAVNVDSVMYQMEYGDYPHPNNH
ncbi:MAG: hypothetical protein SGBAC_013169 [Bacillariaceae sp.]